MQTGPTPDNRCRGPEGRQRAGSVDQIGDRSDGRCTLLHPCTSWAEHRTRERTCLRRIKPSRKSMLWCCRADPPTDAASGVAGKLRTNSQGFMVADQNVPIVPAAILFDLLATRDGAARLPNWGKQPCRHIRGLRSRHARRWHGRHHGFKGGLGWLTHHSLRSYRRSARRCQRARGCGCTGHRQFLGRPLGNQRRVWWAWHRTQRANRLAQNQTV